MYHQEPAVLESVPNTINDEISDGITTKVHHVSISIDRENKDNRDITITSRIGNNKGTTINLKYINASHNGLIQYYYEADNRNHEANFICKAIPNAIYHLIKGFFHEHEYHNPKGDSTLLAYTSDSEVNIKEQDNKALIYYLEQYEEKFRGYRDLAFEKLQFIEEKNNESAEEYYMNYLMRHSNLDTFCNNALGESLYYEALLYSWYNDSCKYDTTGNVYSACNRDDTKSENSKHLHRLALNAKNAIDSIRIIQFSNKHLFDYKNSGYTIKALEGIVDGNKVNQKLTTDVAELVKDVTNLIRNGEKLSKNSYFVGWTSVILGIVSLLLGGWSIWLALNP